MEAVIIAAFGGGVIRGLVGFVKYLYAYKEVKFEPARFVSTVVLSGIIGAVAAGTMSELGFEFLGSLALSPAMALIIGYAGGDFIENVYKIVLKKPNLYSFRKNSGK